MAAKRKTTKKKATATEKAKKLDGLQYSSGKIDDETISHIEELEKTLGVHEVNHFGTNDPKIFENKMSDMTLVDLQKLCGKARLFASGNRKELKEKLRKEFRRVTKGQKSIVLQNQAGSVCDPNHPDHEKAKKILGEGF